MFMHFRLFMQLYATTKNLENTYDGDMICLIMPIQPDMDNSMVVKMLKPFSTPLLMGPLNFKKNSCRLDDLSVPIV